MQGHLGKISFLQRLQDGLQSRAPLLKACHQSRGTAVKQLLDRGLSRRTECFRGARTPGECGRTAALRDPNRVVPLDALRALERAGVIGRLLDDLFVTVGNMGSLNAMQRIGAEIAATLVQRGVQAVVLPAT